MKWRPYVYGDNTFLLEHLHPFEWRYECPASEKRPARTYPFHVTFSMHCFTRDPLPDESEIDPDMWYQGPKERRLFCFDRYEESKGLPALIQTLGERACWHTHHGNFFTIETLDPNSTPRDYEVYFDVTRASRQGWLNLVIQSAYVRTPEYQTQQPRKRKIRFGVIAYNIQAQKPIRPPGR
jgi:hypothetical protein